MQLTAVFRKVSQGYIGFVEELPGANTQAATLEEARRSLREAVTLVMEANRALGRRVTQNSVVGHFEFKIVPHQREKGASGFNFSTLSPSFLRPEWCV